MLGVRGHYGQAAIGRVHHSPICVTRDIIPMILELRAFQYDGTRLADANRMKVFGDSTIKLNQHEITFNARDANNNPTSCSFKINGESIGAAPFTTTVINRASLVEAFDATHAFDHFS